MRQSGGDESPGLAVRTARGVARGGRAMLNGPHPSLPLSSPLMPPSRQHCAPVTPVVAHSHMGRFGSTFTVKLPRG